MAFDPVTYALAKKAGGGGGGGGTSDYDDLTGKPKINGVTLSGNKSAADLGLADANDKADVIVSATSGTVASFPDGMAGAPVQSVVVTINPAQSGSGDPTGSNIRPISGWTGCEVGHAGRNLLDASKAVAGKYLNNSGNVATNADYRYWPYYIPVTPGGPITVSMRQLVSESRLLSVCKYDKDKNFLGRVSGTGGSTAGTYQATVYPQDAYFVRISAPVEAQADRVQVEYGDAATAYSGADVTLITTIWMFVAGTVYAGTFDLISGELRVRPYYASYNGETLVGPWISDRDVYAEGTSPATGAQVVDLGGTETVYQLTARSIDTMLGVNNIWADCGPVDVTYRADTKLYIAKLTGQTGDTLVADANIASGKYFVIGNRLFLSTASIASGAAVVPGTNCTETNLAAALNAINT